MKIVKGCLIPEYHADKFLNAIEIEDETAIFSSILSQTLNLIKSLIKKIETSSDLRIFNDTYVLLIDGLFSKMRRNSAIKLINSFFKKDLSKILDEYFEKNKEKAHKFFSIPADTRPLANISSLWVHSKTVSAFAVLDYLNTLKDQSNPEYVELIRFASLFHDIAKPFNRKAHIQEAPRIINQFFERYIKEDYLYKILEWIKGHHNPNTEAFIKRIQDADRVSSGIERKTQMIKNKLIAIDSTKFNWVQEEFDNWAKWEDIENELISITDQLIADFRQEEATSKMELKPQEKPTLALVLGDARGIKEFVDNSLKLKEIKGGAILVDEALTVQINSNFEISGCIAALHHSRIPPECIVFYGGGNILFFADLTRITEIETNIKNSFLDVTKNGLGFSITHLGFELKPDLMIGSLYNNLKQKLSIQKMELLQLPPESIEMGFKQLCSSCGKSVATIKNEENFICSSCFLKRVVVTQRETIRSFRYIWETNYEKTFIRPWNDLSDNVLEFIGGWSLDTCINPDSVNERRPAIAIIKADGNNMGQFFGTSRFITELLEKSILTDITMDRCIEKIHMVIDTINTSPTDKDREEMHARIDLGIIYSGGDDFLMFAPSWAAIPFSLILMEEFNKLMGNMVKLSVGIIAGDPKQPQNYLVKAAEKLLGNAKALSRKDKDSSNTIGYLDYENIEGGTYTPDIIQINRKELEHYIKRPFKISNWHQNDKNSFIKMIQEITNETIITAKELIGFLHKNQRALIERSDNRLIEIRNRLYEILNRFTYEDYNKDTNYAIMFLIYQFYRITDSAKNDIKQIYQKIGLNIASSLINKNNPAYSLIDEFILLKLFGGGFL